MASALSADTSAKARGGSNDVPSHLLRKTTRLEGGGLDGGRAQLRHDGLANEDEDGMADFDFNEI